MPAERKQSVESQYSGSCPLQAGDKLQLQFLEDPDRGRFQVTVIGYVEGVSLIISAPRHNGHIMLLREGQLFVVRLLAGKKIISFNSEVMKVYNNPFAYVHLKPPAEVLQVSVRNAYRVQMDNIASVQPLPSNEERETGAGAGKVIAGKIRDMSTTGCLLQLIKPLPADARHISVSTRVVVAEQERLLSFEGEIRSCREAMVNDRKMTLYGVEFGDMNDDKRLLLHCFVNERLVRELLGDAG